MGEIPEGDWYCDTCKHLKPQYTSPHSRGFLRRLENRERARRNRRNNIGRNRYDDIMISRNENNPEWLATQDEDWQPEIESDDEDESENDEELEELKEDKPKYDGLKKFSFNGNNKKRK